MGIRSNRQFTGPRAAKKYQALHIIDALKRWSRRKEIVYPQWNPKVLMNLAQDLTGKKFKRYDYKSAILALLDFVEDKNEQEPQEGN